MKYKLVIFDFDGTLAESYPWFMSVINKLADKHRFKHIEDHELENLRGCHARKVMKHLGVSMWRMPMIGRDLRRMMAQDIHKIRRFSGVDELLQTLHDHGFILAVLTSNSHDNVVHVLGEHNASLFRYFECGISMFGKRPKLRKLLKKAHVKHTEAICIGDEVRDAEAAKHECIAFGGVTWGYTKVEALQALGPIEVFHTIEDIKTKLLA